MSIFRDRLVYTMQVRGMTQSELAEKTGLTKASISQYVNGVYDAKPEALAKLADALNTSWAWLTGRSDSMEKDVKKNCDEDDLCDCLSKFYDKEVCGRITINAIGEFLNLISDDAENVFELLKLYKRLDSTDRIKACGRIEEMLENEKYKKKESSGSTVM